MKRFIGFLVVALLGVLSQVTPSQADIVFSGGSGTSIDPYQIATSADLRFLSATNSYWQGANRDVQGPYFILTTDIDLGGPSQMFAGIGSHARPFTGSFNGGNKSISGLAMTGSDAGMFLEIGGTANLKDFQIVAPQIHATNRAGALVVEATGGTKVQNVSVVGGSVTVPTALHVGGLIASADAMEIFNSSSSATVSVTAASQNASGVGGLVGLAKTNTKIVSSYATGAVSYLQSTAPNLNASFGGLVGIAWPAMISFSTSSASVTFSVQALGFGAGGLIGRACKGTYLQNLSSGRVTDTLAVSTDPARAGQGGFIGFVEGGEWCGPGTLAGNLWDKDSSGQANDPAAAPAQVEGKSSAQLANFQTFVDAGWMSADYPKDTGTWGALISAYPAATPPAPAPPTAYYSEPSYAPQASFTAKGRMTTLKRTSGIALEGGSGQGVVTYKSLTEAICAVDSNGVISGLSAGQCEVEVGKAADGFYLAATATMVVQILTPYQKLWQAPEGITSQDIQSIRGRYLSYLRSDLFQQLSTTALASLSSKQIKLITKRQFAALNKDQRKALKR